MTRRIVTCARCHRNRHNHGRGLCDSCYIHEIRYGNLTNYTRHTIPLADLLEDWELLSRNGYTRAQAAERLGIKKARLEKAIERGRRVLT